MTDYVEKAMRQNGCEIVTKMYFDGRDAYGRDAYAPQAIVIAKRDTKYHPFVVWRINTQCGGAYGGGYHENIGDAWEDYAERVERELYYLGKLKLRQVG